MMSFWSDFTVSTGAASVGLLHFHLSFLSMVEVGRAPWVGSQLEMWTCPIGYRPSYFVLEGGKGVGRSIRESQAPLLCRSTPRALAEDWWSVRAQSCLPDRAAMQCPSTNQHCFSYTHAVVFLLTRVKNENCTQLVIFSDIHCY